LSRSEKSALTEFLNFHCTVEVNFVVMFIRESKDTVEFSKFTINVSKSIITSQLFMIGFRVEKLIKMRSFQKYPIIVIVVAAIVNNGWCFVVYPSKTWTARKSSNNIDSKISIEKNTFSKIFQHNHIVRQMTTTSNDADTMNTNTSTEQKTTRRILGSQELLMLPRQYGVSKDVQFPSMNHVSCTLLNLTPDRAVLIQAVQHVMDMHPLLQSHVEGDGEPEKRIDLFQMVRKGEPNPLMFVVNSDKKFDASKDVVTFIDTANDEKSLQQGWKSAFQRDLDNGSWCNVHHGPLWKLEVHTINGQNDTPCALLFSFNHAISDQGSANRLADQIVRTVAEIESGNTPTSKQMEPMPVAMEDSVLGMHNRWNDVETAGLSINTIQYVIGKAAEGLRNPVILPMKDSDTTNPLLGAVSIISGREAGGKDTSTMSRKSTVQFRTLSNVATTALLTKCHENGVTVSNALTAAMTYTATDFIGNNEKRNYKILQSLDMRRFGAKLDNGTTVACMAGSHDLIHGPLQDGSGKELRTKTNEKTLSEFWKLAKEANQQTSDFIQNDSNGPKQAVRVFDFAMSISDLNNLVYLTSQSQDTKGRAYSAGVTNVGVYEKQKAFGQQQQPTGTSLVQNQHGRYKIDAVYYATPHTQSGCLFPMSCMTVDGKLHFTFNPVDPIVDEETNSKFADNFIEILETITETRQNNVAMDDNAMSTNLLSQLPENSLTLATAFIGLIAVASHGGAWIDFFHSVAEMKGNIEDPADFWAALNFWIFFAVGHPILPPILWISDVLHGSPGPKIADIVPFTFLAGNLIAIAAVTVSKEVRFPYDL
jgi:hypothetical protein